MDDVMWKAQKKRMDGKQVSQKGKLALAVRATVRITTPPVRYGRYSRRFAWDV